MSETRYNIGDVVYVILKNVTDIAVCQVVEEETKKLLSGVVEKKYVFKTSSGDLLSSVDLFDAAQHVFLSIEDLQRHLEETAARTIKALVVRAQNKASKFKTETSQVQLTKQDLLLNNDVEASTKTSEEKQLAGTVRVKLPDGSVAYVKE